MKKMESGRSMVEMLGVLAIIGVLSIGGIAGYTMAMNRWRANEIIDTASKVGVLALTKEATGAGTATLADLGINGQERKVGGSVTEMTSSVADGVASVKLTGNLPSGVENAIGSIAGSSWASGTKTIKFDMD